MLLPGMLYIIPSFSKKENNFIKRNAINSLSQLKLWRNDIEDIMVSLLSNPYFEVRIAAINYLNENMPKEQYSKFRAIMISKLSKTRIEEKIAYIKFISRFGGTNDLDLLRPYFLHSNSLLREEILTLLLSFYKKGLLNSDEVKDHISSILITSNNMRAEFRLKQLIRIIYREIK